MVAAMSIVDPAVFVKMVVQVDLSIVGAAFVSAPSANGWVVQKPISYIVTSYLSGVFRQKGAKPL
jgi:hypothetical protein